MPRRVLPVKFPTPTPPPVSSTPWLPFDMPAAATFDASTVLAAPHAMDFWLRSFDDKNADTDTTEYGRRFWDPPGAIEGSTDHRTYGGYWRTRPLSRTPLGAGYQLADKRWEAQQIKATGMRHVIVNFGGNSTTALNEWAQATILEGMPAAVIPMPDSGYGVSAPTLAATLTSLFSGTYAAGFRKHTDGRWLVMPFGPEGVAGTTQGVIDYWTTVMTTLSNNGRPSALWPCFVNSWDNATARTAPVFTGAALAQWTVGLGRWGTGDPVQANEPSANNNGAAASCQSKYGLPWLGHARVEDNRPRSDVFFEAGGWDNYLSALTNAIDTPTTALQIPTWNDWAEQTGIAPNTYHGWADLDVLAYFIHKFRLGSYPTIVRDTLFLAHRTHRGPAAGSPTFTAGTAYTRRMSLGGSTAERNVIDVLVFATAAGTVEITANGSVVKTQAVSAGVSRVTTPLVEGTISCHMTRSGSTVTGTSVTSPWPVNFTSQLVQDLTYRRISSRR